MSSDDRYKFYFSREEERHEYRVGFLVHKDIVSAVLGCQPVFSRLISIRLRAVPFNVTIIQVSAPTPGHDDNEVDNFYQQLQEITDQHLRRRVWLCKGVGMLTLEGMHMQTGETCVDPMAMLRQMREVSEFFYNIVRTNYLGPHKPSRRWTWHCPDRKHYNQIDYILLRKRFLLGAHVLEHT